MPSDSKDSQGSSSSLRFFQSGFYPSEVGFQNTEATPNREARGSVALLLNKQVPVKNQMVKQLEHPGSRLIQNKQTSIGMHPVGAESEASHSLTLLRPVDQDAVKLTSYFAEGRKNSMLGAQYENALFSSSMSEIFNRKMTLSSNNAPIGNSAEIVASHHEGEEPFQSLEEIEAQTIGDLLPKDDELLSGMIDDIDYIAERSNADDMQELDFFSSVGGMDLGDDSSSNSAVSFELLYNNSLAGQHPSRTLFVRNINSNVEDSELKALFEQYGDIRTFFTACKHRGFVMVSYYDIRSAWNAMKALQNKVLRRRKLDIHYSIPKDNPSDKDVNQGTLGVFNLDSSVSNAKLCEIFGAFGEIKEIHETPHRSDQKFIEFYDVRAAEVALQALNRSDIAGKQIKLEPSHPGVTRCLVQQFHSEFDRDEFGHFIEQSSSACDATTSFTGSLPHLASTPGSINRNILGINCNARGPINPLLEGLPKGLQSLLGADSPGNPFNFAKSDQSQGHLKFDTGGTSSFHAHLPAGYKDGLVDSGSAGTMTRNINPREEIIDNRKKHGVNLSGLVDIKASGNYNFGSANGSCPVPGHSVTWGNSYHLQPPKMMWQNSTSASFVNNIGSPHPPQIPHGVERAPSIMLNPALSVINHVGSAPTVNPLWSRRPAYVGNSPDAFGVPVHPSSLGSMRMSNNALHSVDFVSHNIFPPSGGNCLDLRRKSLVFQAHQQNSTMFPGRNQMLPMMNSFDPSSGRDRSHRNESCSNQVDRRQFELDIERIMRGEDSRTTLMIKNIPNKYTSKMLLGAIDEGHKGTYDFIYLPIDFKNKCNVGYAFINMTEPKHIVPLYQTFNGKKWEKFNSEKVASLAYARIQGKTALIAHFQNSSLMTEDKRCRPMLFNTDGPNAGDPVPFPTGVNIKNQPAKLRANEYRDENPPTSANEENLSFVEGDTSPASAKQSE